MKGSFFVQLHNFIISKNSEELWKEYLKKAGILESKLYFSNQQYDEDEFFKIIKEAVNQSGLTRDKFLESFGIHMSVIFLEIYSPIFRKEWKTLDILEHIEEFNFNIMQAGDTSPHAGKFQSRRIDPLNLHIIYCSPRKLCPAVVGLIKGIATHYKEQTLIKQTRCALKGDPECHIHISLIVGMKEKRNQLKLI